MYQNTREQFLNLNVAPIIFIWITTVHNDALVHSMSEVIVQYRCQLITQSLNINTTNGR